MFVITCALKYEFTVKKISFREMKKQEARSRMAAIRKARRSPQRRQNNNLALHYWEMVRSGALPISNKLPKPSPTCCRHRRTFLTIDP